MKSRKRQSAASNFLGIECGATHSVALLVDAGGRLIQRHEAGPANVRLLTDRQLVRHFRGIAKLMPSPVAIAIGLAGARTETDRERIRQSAAKAWPGIPCYATNDLETGLMAAESAGTIRSATATKQTNALPPRVLVLSGTGSCCFGRDTQGRTVKVGGWGHLLGDKGSGYEIGMRALQEVIRQFDACGIWPALGSRILRALQINDPEDLIAWTHAADKPDIAHLAIEVFAAAQKRDPIARDILSAAAQRLAEDAVACAKRVARRHAKVHFVFAGSVLLKQPGFARKITLLIRANSPQAKVTSLRREGALGAVELARQLKVQGSKFTYHASRITPHVLRLTFHGENDQHLSRTLVQSPTEQRNPRSRNLDRMPIAKAIELMLSEDAKIPDALRVAQKPIERAIRLIARALKRGGRLFYVGAGTSGRLGVLDASECPPTFSVPPDLVQGIMAGGYRALWQSIEGAEDDPDAGGHAVQYRGVSSRDVVVGIAASGRTPFVWGALRAAKSRRATTVLVCFNPSHQIPRADRPAVVIAPNVGPEVLTGSTRLKAGTATKLVLNILTTLAMVQLGKVRSNLMIDVAATNQKLRNRATRILSELTGLDYAEAHSVMVKANWSIPLAYDLFTKKPPPVPRRKSGGG